VPASLAARVCRALSIPVSGIGAGPQVDGQVLVLHDLLGLTTDFSPRFVRRYAALGNVIEDACRRYVADVKGGEFPNENESY